MLCHSSSLIRSRLRLWFLWSSGCVVCQLQAWSPSQASPAKSMDVLDGFTSPCSLPAAWTARSLDDMRNSARSAQDASIGFGMLDSVHAQRGMSGAFCGRANLACTAREHAATCSAPQTDDVLEAQLALTQALDEQRDCIVSTGAATSMVSMVQWLRLSAYRLLESRLAMMRCIKSVAARTPSTVRGLGSDGSARCGMPRDSAS